MKTWADYNIQWKGNQHGPEIYTTCPQCSPGRKAGKKNLPCLSVNVEKEVWFCHHCNWTGTLKGGNDRQKFEAAVQTPPEYIAPDYNPQAGLTQAAIDWFARRGIPEDVVRRNRITTGEVWMPQADGRVNTIQFPFYRDGKVVNIKYRDHHKHFRMVGRAERLFYGLDDVDEMTVIVEGEMDKLALETAGIRQCISVPDGAPGPETKDYTSKFTFMDKAMPRLEKVRHFVIAVDMDAPGRRLEEELIKRLGRHRCAIVRWPEGCKDANDTLLKHGTEKILELVYSAEPPPVEGTVRVLDFMAKLEEFYERGMEPGLDPGWKTLAPYYKVGFAEWTLVTGIPGHGKSEFLDALLVNLANNHDWKIAIYSPENAKLELHMAKLLEKKAGKSMAGPDSMRMTRDELRKAAAWLHHHFFFLDDPADGNALKMSGILKIAGDLVDQHGIQGLVIDPWNELDHQMPAGLTETNYISQELGKLRRFCRTKLSRGHAWLVAHPRIMQKEQTGERKGLYPVPTPYDVSGSANWRNKAFNCIAVWRSMKEGDPVEIHVQKIKAKQNGRVGVGYLHYSVTTGRYTDPVILL